MSILCNVQTLLHLHAIINLPDHTAQSKATNGHRTQYTLTCRDKPKGKPSEWPQATEYTSWQRSRHTKRPENLLPRGWAQCIEVRTTWRQDHFKSCLQFEQHIVLALAPNNTTTPSSVTICCHPSYSSFWFWYTSKHIISTQMTRYALEW